MLLFSLVKTNAEHLLVAKVPSMLPCGVMHRGHSDKPDANLVFNIFACRMSKTAMRKQPKLLLKH